MGIILVDEHDAFVSYAHDDNVLCDDAVQLFRTLLKRRFEAEMRRRLELPHGSEAVFFMDRFGLPSNGSLSVELERAVKSSVFLFIFIGVSYPKSTWCSRELEAFVSKFSGGRPEALQRTFIVVLEKDAVRHRWGASLEEPDRPIYEEFFDEVTGKIIPFMLEGPDGQAYQSPRLTRRLRSISETMAERALQIINVAPQSAHST